MRILSKIECRIDTGQEATVFQYETVGGKIEDLHHSIRTPRGAMQAYLEDVELLKFHNDGGFTRQNGERVRPIPERVRI